MDPVTVSLFQGLWTIGGMPLLVIGFVFGVISLLTKVTKMEKTLEQMAKIINQVDRRLLTIEIQSNIEP
jgi:hypothetical protein